MEECYGSDLAYIHDVGFTDFARRAAPALLDLLKESGIASGRVVDLGCGSGVWGQALHDAGHPVVGIDQSAAMIALASRRVPQADWRCRSFLAGDLPDCSAVTSIGECLNYMVGEDPLPLDLERLFRRVYEALASGGVLIFDLLGPECADEDHGRVTRQSGQDWSVTARIEADRSTRILTRRITSRRRVGGMERCTREVHRQLLHPSSEIEASLRSVGYRVRHLDGYGDVRFRRGHDGFLAQKPTADR